MNSIRIFDDNSFTQICDELIKRDVHLANIVSEYGYPTVWKRKPNFETLIHIILEQQVSLASAKAALNKLKEKIGIITPKKVISLTDAELKACYFSRQKISYAKHLAQSIISKHLKLEQLEIFPDETVRAELKKVKGIGDWTTDVYLMMALQRADLFPLGDIALVKSMKEIKNLPPLTSKEEIFLLAEQWRPFRTIAAYLLWHAYIKKRKMVI